MKTKKSSQFCKYGHDTFSVGRNDRNQCLECRRRYRRNWNRRNPKYGREKNWSYRNMINADGTKFTMENYMDLLQKQDGKCALPTCSTPQSSLKKSLHADHDHETGIVRGLLCNKCNKALGLFNNKPALLLDAVRYLEK